jgi:hypothetical protein
LVPALVKYFTNVLSFRGYQAEKSCLELVTPVVCCRVQYFDLEIYTTSRQEKALDQLLKLIQETVEKRSETEVSLGQSRESD